MSDIHTAHDTHREDLLQEGLTVLGRYTHFSSTHRVTFSQVGGPAGRPSGAGGRHPHPPERHPLDQKLAHLKDQTVVIRPFFLPMANSPLGRGGRQHLHPGGL